MRKHSSTASPACMGDEDWKRIQAARWRQDITARAYRAEMVNLMRLKLEYELGYQYSHRIPMQMHNKVTIFDMVFASDHWAGDRSCATCTTERRETNRR